MRSLLGRTPDPYRGQVCSEKLNNRHTGSLSPGIASASVRFRFQVRLAAAPGLLGCVGRTAIGHGLGCSPLIIRCRPAGGAEPGQALRVKDG